MSSIRIKIESRRMYNLATSSVKSLKLLGEFEEIKVVNKVQYRDLKKHLVPFKLI
jgi:hypothetical protein